MAPIRRSETAARRYILYIVGADGMDDGIGDGDLAIGGAHASGRSDGGAEDGS